VQGDNKKGEKTMRFPPIGRTVTLALSACVLSMILIGCGGGAEDPTSVALRPNKEQPQGGGGNGTTQGNGGAGDNGAAAVAPAEGFGGITGRIVIADADKGSVPPPTVALFAVGKATVDSGYCAKDMPILDERLLVNPMTGGIKNTFFYLDTKPKGGKSQIESQKSWPTADESGAKLVLDQRNCTYVPHAMILLAGQPFTAQSQDTVVHSYKFSPPRNPGDNVTIPANGTKEYTFGRSEKVPFPISCATHSWMSGYQLPLDHPYAAVTDDDGRFTISDLPSGTHTFVIWHEKATRGKIRDYDVEVKANETVDLGNIQIRLSDLAK
jgi:hypothetical protein